MTYIRDIMPSACVKIGYRMNILLQRVAAEWYTCVYMILSHAVLFFYLPGIAVLNPLNRVAATGRCNARSTVSFFLRAHLSS